jgi:PAS domain S-box-containing protein
LKTKEIIKELAIWCDNRPQGKYGSIAIRTTHFRRVKATLVPGTGGFFLPLWKSSSAARAALAQAIAISKSQAVIEFNMDGTIVTANQNFLDTMGYRLGEIVGKHHRMFVAPEQRDSAAYREFWAKLGHGEFQSAEYKREISEAMAKSKETAHTAVGRVEAADQQAQRLTEASESMSSIVQLIGAIHRPDQPLGIERHDRIGAGR